MSEARSVGIPDAAVKVAYDAYISDRGISTGEALRTALAAARPYLMPTREPISDEAVEDFCREAWPKFYEWDEQTKAVFRRTARRALELPLPIVPTRQQIAEAIDPEPAERHPDNPYTLWLRRKAHRDAQVSAVLALLSTSGESKEGTES